MTRMGSEHRGKRGPRREERELFLDRIERICGIRR